VLARMSGLARSRVYQLVDEAPVRVLPAEVDFAALIPEQPQRAEQ
jgi:hypothetical protein